MVDSFDKFETSAPLKPTASQRKFILKFLYAIPDTGRPAIGSAAEREVGRRFPACPGCPSQGPLKIHHIVPWREALLIFDLKHDQPENLIRLCGGCHGRADDEHQGYGRFEVSGLGCAYRESRGQILKSSLTYTSHGFDAKIALGLHRDMFKNLVPGTTDELEAASIARRVGRLDKALRFLADKERSTVRRNVATRARIEFERSKISILMSDLDNAKYHASESVRMASDGTEELPLRICLYRHKWIEMKGTTSGTLRGDTAALGELGLSLFPREVAESGNGLLAEVNHCVYALFDSAETSVALGRYPDAVAKLAHAARIIDSHRLRTLRPFLYRILAEAFYQREDYWRSVLAGSVSTALHYSLGIRDSEGLAWLFYMKGLRALGLDDYFSAVNARRTTVRQKMGNTWAVQQMNTLCEHRNR